MSRSKGVYLQNFLIGVVIVATMFLVFTVATAINMFVLEHAVRYLNNSQSFLGRATVFSASILFLFLDLVFLINFFAASVKFSQFVYYNTGYEIPWKT